MTPQSKCLECCKDFARFLTKELDTHVRLLYDEKDTNCNYATFVIEKYKTNFQIGVRFEKEPTETGISEQEYLETELKSDGWVNVKITDNYNLLSLLLLFAFKVLLSIQDAYKIGKEIVQMTVKS